MHVIFMLYGIKNWVDHLLMDMQAEKFPLKLTKEGELDKSIWIQGSLRLLPFGVYDYVFPKEAKDVVLTTLNFDKPAPYNLGKLKLFGLRKLLGIKPTPEFNKDKQLLWVKDHVSIIPLGIKEDVDMTENKGDAAGWTHEML